MSKAYGRERFELHLTVEAVHARVPCNGVNYESAEFSQNAGGCSGSRSGFVGVKGTGTGFVCSKPRATGSSQRARAATGLRRIGHPETGTGQSRRRHHHCLHQEFREQLRFERGSDHLPAATGRFRCSHHGHVESAEAGGRPGNGAHADNPRATTSGYGGLRATCGT